MKYAEQVAIAGLLAFSQLASAEISREDFKNTLRLNQVEDPKGSLGQKVCRKGEVMLKEQTNVLVAGRPYVKSQNVFSIIRARVDQVTTQGGPVKLVFTGLETDGGDHFANLPLRIGGDVIEPQVGSSFWSDETGAWYYCNY